MVSFRAILPCRARSARLARCALSRLRLFRLRREKGEGERALCAPGEGSSIAIWQNGRKQMFCKVT